MSKGFLEYFKSLHPSKIIVTEHSEDFDREKMLEFYMLFPKKLEGNNPMLIGYSQVFQERVRWKKMDYRFRVLLLYRDNTIKAVVVSDWEANDIIGVLQSFKTLFFMCRFIRAGYNSITSYFEYVYRKIINTPTIMVFRGCSAVFLIRENREKSVVAFLQLFRASWLYIQNFGCGSSDLFFIK